MKVTYKLRAPRLDLAGYKKALDRYMRELIVQAASTWLDNVALDIPVWSGASRATFLKLAREVGYSLSDSSSGVDRVARGEASGTGALTVDSTKGLYTFTYGTTLPWLIWNEYHNANVDPDPTKWPNPPFTLHAPGPYGFQAIGARAFRKFAETATLPLVAPFVN
jgi:hypothetical protein